MEWGPRALGNRSILADSRSRTMQRELNLKIKFRESFRPFAPVVLEEARRQYFDLEDPSPYMLFVSSIASSQRTHDDNIHLVGLERLKNIASKIPAVTHVDYTARVQTVNAKQNPRLYRLIKAFEKLTGYSLLVNTSFNVRDEPIVCTPKDAFRCFQKTGIDILVMGNTVVTSENKSKTRFS